MARTTYIAIPSGLEEHYWHGLQSSDRFVLPKIRVKSIIQSRPKVANLLAKTYLFECKDAWAGLTTEEKQNWKDVDFHVHKHGWRTFVADQCKRIKYGLPGTATPNQYHQDLVGLLKIEAPAEELKITQTHPYQYWVQRKIKGKKSMYELVEINEFLTLPLKIGISYHSDLTSTGTGSFAKFYAEVLHFYQGQNLTTNLEINLNLSQAWTRVENTLSSIIGEAIAYNLYIHLYKVQGELYIDNVLSEHNSQNWARDIYCKKIEQSFTRGFYQVPKSWAPVTLPDNAQYKSVYPD